MIGWRSRAVLCCSRCPLLLDQFSTNILQAMGSVHFFALLACDPSVQFFASSFWSVGSLLLSMTGTVVCLRSVVSVSFVFSLFWPVGSVLLSMPRAVAGLPRNVRQSASFFLTL